MFVQYLRYIWWRHNTNKNYQRTSKKYVRKAISEEVKQVVYSRIKRYLIRKRKLKFIQK